MIAAAAVAVPTGATIAPGAVGCTTGLAGGRSRPGGVTSHTEITPPGVVVAKEAAVTAAVGSARRCPMPRSAVLHARIAPASSNETSARARVRFDAMRLIVPLEAQESKRVKPPVYTTMERGD
ncbi:MAG: hypothetical protein Kow00120_22480 [Anaerolineae bacterium]